MGHFDLLLKTFELAKSVSARVNFRKFCLLFSWVLIITVVFVATSIFWFYIYWAVNNNNQSFLAILKIFTEQNILVIFIIFSIVSTYLIFWLYWYIIYEFFYLQKNYNNKAKKILNDWEFQGILKENNGKLILSCSDSGCILKGHKWRDFEMEFEFKLRNKEFQRGFGLIIRAEDLENYIMLKLDDYVTPHIRFNKFWEVISTNDCPLKIVDGQWHSCKLEMLNNEADLIIDKDTKYHYNLPSHSGISLKLLGIREDPENPNSAGKINFRNFGSVGFRAWGYQSSNTESVEIKNLKIRRKNTFNSLGLEL